MRSVKVYKGKEIDNEKIAKIKEIAKARYTKEIYETTFWSIENIENLAYYLHNISVDDEILVLGEDWFLCFTISDNIVEFLEWVAIDTKSNKLAQSIEMMNVLKRILFDCRNKEFHADMRHDTSYQFYFKMLQRGYFKETFCTVDIDYCNGYVPEQIRNIYYNYPGIETFLNSDEARNNPENLKYILHCLTFYVTNKFVEKCSKLTRKF